MTKDVNKDDNTGGKSILNEMKETAHKYGIEVTGGAERGIRAIGVLGGISEKYDKKTSNL